MKDLNLQNKNVKSLKSRAFYRPYGVGFLILLVAVLVLHLALPDKAYSSTEKRSLTQAPELSASSLVSGSFMSSAEDYMADQFPGRELLMSVKADVTYFLGERESQGVYYGSHDMLIERFEEPDAELLKTTTEAVKAFAEEHSDMISYFMIVPTQVEIMAEYLPSYAPNGDMAAYISDFYDGLGKLVTPIEVTKALNKAKDAGTKVYYASDHHWTTDGAYAAFERAADVMGLTVGTYKKGVVSNTFVGSLASKSGYSLPTADTVTVYLPEEEEHLYVTMADGTVKSSLYDMDALAGDNAYEVFLGGNYPSFTITTAADTEKSLLVFKDSYANCFLPFLTGNYQTITVIDPRYYSDDLETYLSSHSFDDVLFLYNASTLSQDTSLAQVLTGWE